MYDHFYGVDSLHSGVFHFDSHNDREHWLLDNDTRQSVHAQNIDREIRTYWQGQETFTTWGDLKPGDYCEGRWTVLTVEHHDLGDGFGVVVKITTDKGKRSDFTDAPVVVWRHPASPVTGTNLIITDPGKFEGQRSIVEDAYNIYLDGFAEDEDEDTLRVEVPVEYRGKVPSKFETVRFIETDQGFIEEVQS